MDCLRTFKHTPTPAIKMATDVPPLEINGSGSPVGGMDPVTTAIFKSVCTAIKIPTPSASKHPNLSFAESPTLKSKKQSNINTPISKSAPTKPNSSPIIEKMKSLSAKGKKRYFWRELKSPTPKSPPFPRL